VIIPAMSATILFAEIKAPVEGFGGIKWGQSIEEVRKGIKGKIVYDDEKRMIVTRDGEITYRYGFFYKLKEAAKPASAPVQDKTPATSDKTDAAQPVATDKPKDALADKPTEKQPEPVPASGEEKEGDSKFFFVISEFPYIPLDEIKKKMTTQYGDSSGDTVNKAQGAILWDTGNGVAIVWVDAYEKKPFCRKITYLSKGIAKELNSYQVTVFNKREIEVIKSLVP
jgi:hypothetical protein